MSKATDTLKFLTLHNSWRRGDEIIEMQDPTEIGAAIDDAVNLLSQHDELEKENAALRNLLNESYQFFRFGHKALQPWGKALDKWCDRAESLGFKKEEQS